MTVSVVEVDVSQINEHGRHFDDFASLPETVYRGDPHYQPIPKAKLVSALLRESFLDSQKILLVYRDRLPAARLVARIHSDLRDQRGHPYGMFGFFEAVDDQPCANALFLSASDFLKSRGAKCIVGPMDGDTWHRYRLNVGPFDTSPFLMEPYNARFYARLWHGFGFKLLEQYYSQHIVNIEPLIDKLKPLYDRSCNAGFRFRQIDLRNFDRELKALYELTTDIFSDNFLYTDISLADFRSLYADAKSLLKACLVWLALTADEVPIGFVFAIPDYFHAVAAMKGKSGPLAKLRFALNKKKATAVNVKTLGVTSRARGHAVAAALLYLVYSNAYKLGLHQAHACLIREGNASGQFDFGFGRISRRYELYEYQAAE